VSTFAAIDVHAHLLPVECFEVPSSRGPVVLDDRDGQLWLGDIPLQVGVAEMSDAQLVLADMDRARIGIRVLSPPPMGFVVDDVPGAREFCETYNAKLGEVCKESDDRLVGLGTVPLGNVVEAEKTIREISSRGVLRGIAIPPMIGGVTFDEDPFRHVLRLADAMDLAVLVHPVQTVRPGLENHYLRNLLGNPFETSVAIGGLILGGVVEELPALRICFLHGAGCTPSVLGRWDHGWAARPDAGTGTVERPSESFRRLYVDSLTHGASQLTHLAEVAGPHHVVLGSDYPFDMGDPDPVDSALAADLDIDDLAHNARAFLAMD